MRLVEEADTGVVRAIMMTNGRISNNMFRRGVSFFRRTMMLYSFESNLSLCIHYTNPLPFFNIIESHTRSIAKTTGSLPKSGGFMVQVEISS